LAKTRTATSGIATINSLIDPTSDGLRFRSGDNSDTQHNRGASNMANALEDESRPKKCPINSKPNNPTVPMPMSGEIAGSFVNRHAANVVPRSIAEIGKAAEPPFTYPASMIDKPAHWIAIARASGIETPGDRCDNHHNRNHVPANRALYPTKSAADFNPGCSPPERLK